MLGFQTDAKDARQSTSLDCAVISSTGLDISTFSLSMMPAVMPTAEIKGTNKPSGFWMNMKSVVSICGAFGKISWDTVRTGASLSWGILF